MVPTVECQILRVLCDDDLPLFRIDIFVLLDLIGARGMQFSKLERDTSKNKGENTGYVNVMFFLQVTVTLLYS